MIKRVILAVFLSIGLLTSYHTHTVHADGWHQWYSTAWNYADGAFIGDGTRTSFGSGYYPHWVQVDSSDYQFSMFCASGPCTSFNQYNDGSGFYCEVYTNEPPYGYLCTRGVVWQNFHSTDGYYHYPRVRLWDNGAVQEYQ